jgi:hypothetical protein
MRKIGIAVSYAIAIAYLCLILMPAEYSIQHQCSGPDYDGFMPAFLFIPLGGVATAFALRDAAGRIRRGTSWSPVIWPLAVLFGVVLAAIAVLVAIVIYMTAFHR